MAFESVNNKKMRRIVMFLLAAVFAYTALAQEFEVVAVKPNKSLSGSSSTHSDQGFLTATNASLRSLIVMAYGMKDYQVEGPEWLKSEHFDISAKFPQALSKGEKGNTELQAMMQSMLLDRFKLAVHREQKTFSVYGLIVGKTGIKFKQAPDTESHSQNSNNTHYVGTGVSMDAFAAFLARRAGLPADLPVLDMTGLKGFYNLTLDWVPEPKPSGETKADDSPSGPSLLMALQEQLGLKVEARKAPIDILIVDHAEKVPTDN